MVDCTRFLDSYSDYRDGLLPSDRREAVEGHLRACRACARYDRVIDTGVDVIRALPSLRPSPDFRDRLRSRIATLDAPLVAIRNT